MNKLKRYLNWKIIGWIVSLLGAFWTFIIGALLLILLIVVVLLGLNDSGQKFGGCDVSGSSVSSDVSEKGKKMYEQNAKGGELEGKVDSAIKIAKEEKVPPSLFLAIMASESGWGKSANATNQHNPLSIMGSGPLKHYGTIEEGMKAGAKNLYDLYISEGLDTPAKIQPKYAPNGASNDPTDLNSNWKKSVESIQKQLSDGSKSSNKDDSNGAPSVDCSSSSSTVSGGGTLKALSKFKGSLPTPKNKSNAMQPASGNLYTNLECTWYVYNRRKELGIPISTFWYDAGMWANASKKDGYKVGKKPVRGACVTWPIQGGMPHGHVAFVEGVSKDGKKIHISEYNWPPKIHRYGERTIKVEPQMTFIYDKKKK
ncbi:CHAP domain-containing protein [Staphylococcus epidermidis]|nr:CHAP domain-containing protein [Staphylococcus epidermidis]